MMAIIIIIIIIIIMIIIIIIIIIIQLVQTILGIKFGRKKLRVNAGYVNNMKKPLTT